MVCGAVGDQAEFEADYGAGRVVFFAGAGASFDSAMPMPGPILEASAALFLPPDQPALVAQVLKGPGVAGSEFEGIQPEVFYEHLLTLADDIEALGLWRILSAVSASERGETYRPNANHLAMARYGAATGLPVFTTNFDTLFEAAAAALGQPPPEVLLPGTPEEAEAVARLMAGERRRGSLTLFKRHGSINHEGRESLASLRTTMTGIAAVNRPVLRLLEQLGQDNVLTFLGYSGSDIDYLPAIVGFGGIQRPFWFNPIHDPATGRSLRRANARALDKLPGEVFATLSPALAGQATPWRDHSAALAALAANCPVALSPAQKVLLLGLCLNSIGRNAEAEGLLLAAKPTLRAALPARDWIGALVLLARLQDCTSLYDQSVAHGREALVEIGKARRAGVLGSLETAILRARALYQVSMSEQLRIGPILRYGSEQVDWQPPMSVMGRQLLSALATGARLEQLRLSIRWLRRLAGGQSWSSVRAEQAINDHAVMILGRLVSFLAERRSPGAALGRRLVRWMLSGLMARAYREGDYFAVAGVAKYLDRLSGTAEQQAGDMLNLLRDPLNYALVRRDAAVDQLKGPGDLEARCSAAVENFLAAAQAGRLCGSRATELKALLGLQACGVATGPDRDRIRRLVGEIEGAGYGQFRRSLVGRLPDG